MSGTLMLGVDVGGTRLKLGLVERVGDDARVRERRVVRATERDAAGLVAAIAREAQALAGGATLSQVGLALAGVLSKGGDRVLQSPNLPWLDGVALPALLAQELGVPVRCDNDANCVGWGEALAGAGRGEPDQLCLALGTGVGGSLVVRGALQHGARGRGVEIGHLNVHPFGAPCGCGGRGCLEQYASQTGLLRLLRERGRAADHPDAVIALFADAREGDPVARDVVQIAGDALGRALAGLRHALGVRCVVIAGGIAGGFDTLAPPLMRTARALGAGDLDLRVGTLGPDAGVLGAALLA